MAKSRARKQIEHQLRQNKDAFDPKINRGCWNGVKPITKIKQNKKKNYCDYDSVYKVAL